jgi:hypothetical protein
VISPLPIKPAASAAVRAANRDESIPCSFV